MMFNLGMTRLLKFKKFIAAIDEEDWNEAGAQMKDSQLADIRNLKIGFGISDALDWCVDSSLEIAKVKVYTPGTSEAPTEKKKEKKI